MPTYTYRCPAGHETSEVYPMGQAPSSVKCQACEDKAPRSYSAPAISFKGSGFNYNEPKF